MKVLFVTSEHPACLNGGLGTFTREYVKELRKFADVICVYFHLGAGKPPLPDETVNYVIRPLVSFDAYSTEARILETAAGFRAQLEPLLREYKPDIIHCNDRQTYLPFRFEDNVFYSSHLIYTDLIASSALNDLYFQEIKVERCALETSSVLAVYSDFAAKSACKLAGGRCSPVVLPLGINSAKNNKLPPNCQRNHLGEDDKINVSYFGRFENVQKGINDFIYAVNLLGKDFKEKHNISYSLYGKGTVDCFMDTSLIDNIGFLQGEDLTRAYEKADIVVMPSKYEPFGLTGLEAMAYGNIVLLPKGLGMDMYAEPGVNCVQIPHDPYGISVVLKETILNLDNLGFMRDNATKTAMKWTWTRCVKAHLEIYKKMCSGHFSQLNSANRIEVREVLDSYKKSSDVQKLYCFNQEEKAIKLFLQNNGELIQDQKILILTGNYVPEDECNFGTNITIVPTLLEYKNGIVVRPECICFDDGEFDQVISVGAWDSVLDPCGSLVELERISKGKVIIMYHKGQPFEWQTVQMENVQEWINFNSRKWRFSGELTHYKTDEIEKSTPFGVVLFKKICEADGISKRSYA